MEYAIHLLIISYSAIVLGSATLIWYITCVIVDWRYKNYYPINYQKLDQKYKTLKNEIQKYKQAFGELPKESEDS